MGIFVPLLMILLCCLLIWRACDGFELASEYIGRNMSEGVRGGTINAISSSIPELLTTIIALFVLNNTEGFSVGIGTTAGSALFNGMIIPAACILAVVGTTVMGVRVACVKVSRKVLLRDGLSLIFCEIVLILIINGDKLHFWQGGILMGLYIAYFLYMILSMKTTGDNGDADDDDDEEDEAPRSALGSAIYWISGGPILDLERHLVRDHHRSQMKDERWNAWPLLLLATGVIGLSCWMLVKACEWLGTGPTNPYTLFGMEMHGFNMPTMFVAVIFASMATSVPDTVISIRDAKDGDYDDAVANALGSNIFDICFALGFPLLVYTLINGSIQLSPEVAAQSGELRLLLLALTIVGFFIYYLGKHGKSDDGIDYVEMGRPKAIVLLAIYVAFAAYVVGRGQEAAWANSIAELLNAVLTKLPVLG